MLLVTGATGLIGSHVAERARALGWEVRALVRRPPGDPERARLEGWGVACVDGDLTDAPSLARAMAGVTQIVHCAAKVGDWGDVASYRRVNVEALAELVRAAELVPGLERFVLLSSLGVYEPRDHFGTDESTPPFREGLDPYTRSKAEAEALVVEAAAAGRLPAVVLRPGFVYGERDRHVLPALIRTLRRGLFAYFGSGEQKLDDIYVGNVVEAVRLALERPLAALGEPAERVFNITDDPVVSRREFVGTVARHAGIRPPTARIPRRAALALTRAVEGAALRLGAEEAPLLSMGRYKFLALDLQFSIERAKRVLGYRPPYAFADGMARAMAWHLAQEGGR